MKFKNSIKNKKHNIENKEDIDTAVESLEYQIIQVFNAASTGKKSKYIQKLPEEISTYIREKNKAKKKYLRTLNPEDKTTLNQLRWKVKDKIKEYNNEN